MPKLFVASAVLLIALFTAPVPTRAGDEVDYSAPYLTVENGELVTKYPPKGHDTGAQSAEPGVKESPESLPQESNAQLLWIIVAAAITAAVALLLIRQWRRDA